MRVHTSNYRVRGFTKSVGIDGTGRPRPEARPAGRSTTPAAGRRSTSAAFGLPGEPLVSATASRPGPTWCCSAATSCSAARRRASSPGKAALIQRIEKDPLMRAFRLDKMTLAALEATLRLYRDPERALREVPTLRMLTTPLAELRRGPRRSPRGCGRCPGWRRSRCGRTWRSSAAGRCRTRRCRRSWSLVTPAGQSEAEFAARLRTGTPAVVGRVQDGKVLLDLRTVFERQEDELSSGRRAAVPVPSRLRRGQVGG